jgi:hypothetical protein
MAPPIYPKVQEHLHVWLPLHLLNLFLFPLLGLAAFMLTRDLKGAAARISNLFMVLFIPVYTGFDALAGIATGTMVRASHSLPPEQVPTTAALADLFWNDPVVFGLGAIGSALWVAGLLAAAVAVTVPERRKLMAIAAVVLFLATGWARSNLFLAGDGLNIRPAWWLVTILSGGLVFAIGKPRTPAALLVLAGALFGAYHVPPTGPLGALCFLVAAILIERASAQNSRAWAATA